MMETIQQKIEKLAIAEAKKDLQKLRNAAKEKFGNNLKINGRALYTLYNDSDIKRAKQGLEPEVSRYKNTNIIDLWDQLVDANSNEIIEEILRARHNGKD